MQLNAQKCRREVYHRNDFVAKLHKWCDERFRPKHMDVGKSHTPHTFIRGEEPAYKNPLRGLYSSFFSPYEGRTSLRAL